MRPALCSVFAFALTLVAPARADDPAAATSTAAPVSAAAPVTATSASVADPSTTSRLPRLGVAVGAGLPEFATLSLLYRPFRMLRLSAGPTWNYAGWGGDVGVTLVPLNSWISPLLGVEAGRFLRSDYTTFVKGSSPGSAAMKGLLRHVDYSYTAVDVGLELGNPRGFSFTLRLGLAWVWADAAGTASSTGDDGTTVSVTNPSVRATVPSAKLGFQYWF